MKNVIAKTGTQLTYSISSIDGQPVGLYWEYSWEILNNATGTANEKGQILNDNPNSNKVYVIWSRPTLEDEVFTLKCHVKIKPNQSVITCEKDVFINVTVIDEEVKLTDNVILVEDTDNEFSSQGAQCKIYNTVNSYKATCLNAKQIKFIVQGGHIILDPSDKSSIIGTTAIKDASNNSAKISVLWDVKNAPKYSITAYGVSGTATSTGSTIIEKVIGTDKIVPVITADSVAVIGEDNTATVTYTLSEFDWNSFPGNYTINVWFQLGTLLSLKPGVTGISDDDYNWSEPENLAGGTLAWYIGQNKKSFSKTIDIPTAYVAGSPTKYRFKLINIEVVGPNQLTNCYVSSNGYGLKGTGWTPDAEYRNDLNLIFCPTDNDFPLPPLDKIIKPSCLDDFILGDIDIVTSPCPSDIILGILKPYKQPIPDFGNIVLTSIFPAFERICYMGCMPPVLGFNLTFCINISETDIPQFGQIGTIHGIQFSCCGMPSTEFDNNTSICVNICSSFIPEFGNISWYNPESPKFNPIPGKQICTSYCSNNIPTFGSIQGIDAPCFNDCFDNNFITVQFGGISGGIDIVPTFGNGTTGLLICHTLQNYPSVAFDNGSIICFDLFDPTDIKFGPISIYGTIIPQFSNSLIPTFCIESVIIPEFGDIGLDKICYNTQLMSDIGFYQLPTYCFTPTVELGAYITLTCQILSVPQVDSDFPDNITLTCQTWPNVSFTIDTTPGLKLCYQNINNFTNL